MSSPMLCISRESLCCLTPLLSSSLLLSSLLSPLSSPRFAIQISRRSIHQRRPWLRVCIIVVGCIYSWDDGVPLCGATTTLLPA